MSESEFCANSCATRFCNSFICSCSVLLVPIGKGISGKSAAGTFGVEDISSGFSESSWISNTCSLTDCKLFSVQSRCSGLILALAFWLEDISSGFPASSYISKTCSLTKPFSVQSTCSWLIIVLTPSFTSDIPVFD